MKYRIGLAFVSLLAALGAVGSAPHSAVAAPAAVAFHAAQPPSPTGGTKLKGVKAAKGLPTAGGVRSLTTCGAGGATACFHYVSGQQAVVTDGLYANSYMANPFLKTAPPADAHSLQELAVQSADQQQIVEVGWTRDLQVCGASSTVPCLFTFAWKNHTGFCYNGCGFVDYAANTLNVGAPVPPADLGTIKQFGIQHSGTGASGAWWVSYNTQWLGYWPDSLWTASPAVTFTTGGFLQVFGEVAGFSTSNWPPCTDMGSGVHGNLGAAAVPKPSSWSATLYNNLPTTSVNLTLSDTYPTGYSHAFSGSATNIRSFSLGGPGANAAGTGVGSTGSC